jgi:ABC-type transport system involved in multi-copper enzyme maturation permease subunit
VSKASARQFLALTGLAVTELFRQPASFLLILSSVACTVLTPLALSFQIGQETHLALDSSLAFEFMFGIILAGYAACATLHNECQSGTILIVFSKPVSRLMFFLSKYLAIALLILFFVFCSSAASLLAGRLSPRNFEIDTLGLRVLLAIPLVAIIPATLINYFTRRSFIVYALLGFTLALLAAVTALSMMNGEGHRVAFGSLLDWRILRACTLEGIALLILAAIALSLASRLTTPTTIAVLAIVLFSGLISDHLITLLPSSESLRFGLRMILPDIQAFWPADRLAGGESLSIAAIAHAAVYGVTYACGVLCLGYAAFRNRQF